MLILLLVPVVSVNFQFSSSTPKAQIQENKIKSLAFETALGDPIPGLTTKEVGRFQSGKFEFERDHTPEEGLGPTFNGTSCVECHGFPVTGGSLDSLNDLTARVGRLTKKGTYDGLENFGGEPLSFLGVVPGCEPQKIPNKAQFVSRRAGQQLFGLGLVDAISDQAILANADPNDKDGDGIKGHPNIVHSIHFGDTRVGRFGWKAHMPTMLDFCADAYVVEIGITSPDIPINRHPNGQKSVCDTSPSPEDFDGRVTNSFNDFISFLAPPPQKPLDASASQGKALFTSIGCAKCHIPTLMTATLAERPDLLSPALASQEVNLYSDLLLHDMGDALRDGIQTGTAGPADWRTQPLWGLSTKKFFLHDGRTSDLSKVIEFHGGEAAKSRDKFFKLKSSSQKDLINFLKSL
jgi:CxxC motif-containing protein (DUF1111 family)